MPMADVVDVIKILERSSMSAREFLAKIHTKYIAKRYTSLFLFHSLSYRIFQFFFLLYMLNKSFVPLNTFLLKRNKITFKVINDPSERIEFGLI